MKDAPLVYEAQKQDISAFAHRYYDRGLFHEMRGRAITFYTSEYFWLHEGEFKKAGFFCNSKFEKSLALVVLLGYNGES